jgi:hypothetical protein
VVFTDEPVGRSDVTTFFTGSRFVIFFGVTWARSKMLAISLALSVKASADCRGCPQLLTLEACHMGIPISETAGIVSIELILMTGLSMLL